MKRLILLLAVVLLMLGGVSATAAADEVGQPAARAENCQHSSGAGTPISAAYVVSHSTGSRYGAVQLCRSGSYYWAYIVLYEPEVYGWWATTHLFRYENGVHTSTWNCNSTGGNGYVEPGQTMCWTPRTYAPNASTTLMASGKDVQGGPYPQGTQRAYGVTARTR